MKDLEKLSLGLLKATLEQGNCSTSRAAQSLFTYPLRNWVGRGTRPLPPFSGGKEIVASVGSDFSGLTWWEHYGVDDMDHTIGGVEIRRDDLRVVDEYAIVA